MEERRWLEIERRLRWAELKTGTVEDILRMVFDKTNMIWDAVPPPEGDGSVPPPTPNPCPGGVYPRFQTPDYIYYPSFNVTLRGDCEPDKPDSGNPTVSLYFEDNCVVMKSYTHKVIYDGTETLIFKRIYDKNGSHTVTDIVNFKIDPYDHTKPVELCYEYDYQKKAKGVINLTANFINFRVVNPDGTLCKLGFYIGDFDVIESGSGSPAILCKSLLPADYEHWRGCEVYGPFKPYGPLPPSVALQTNETVDITIPNTPVTRTYKLTLMDSEVTELPPNTTYTDQAWAVEWVKGLAGAYRGKSLIMKRGKGELWPLTCPHVTSWDSSELQVTYDDWIFVYDDYYYKGLIGGLNECRIAEGMMDLTCDGSSTKVFSSLSSEKVQAPTGLIARGYGVSPREIVPGGNPKMTGRWGIDFGLKQQALTCIGLVPVDSAVSEEWWTPESTYQTERWDPAAPGIFKLKGTCKTRFKWKFEGPL